MTILDRFEKFGTWFIQFFKKSTKDADFVCDEYIWNKLIHITKHEKWQIYFKSEVICGIFAWKFRWKMTMI